MREDSIGEQGLDQQINAVSDLDTAVPNEIEGTENELFDDRQLLLFKRMATTINDQERKAIRDELFEQTIQIVSTVLRINFNSNYAEWDDLRQPGIIGLSKAIDGFDPEQGNKFITYAATKIRGEILKEIHELRGNEIGMRRRDYGALLKLKKEIDNFIRNNNRSPNDDELLEIAGRIVSIGRSEKERNEKIKGLIWAFHNPYVSGSIVNGQNVGGQNDGDTGHSLEDIREPDYDSDKLIKMLRDHRIIDQILPKLSDEDQKILRMKFGLDGTKERTDKEIAQELGLFSDGAVRNRTRQTLRRFLNAAIASGFWRDHPDKEKQ